MLALVFVCVFAACGIEEQAGENTIQLYYLSKSETRVETREVLRPEGTVEEQLQLLLSYLSTEPENLSLKSPLAMGAKLLGMDYHEGRLVLNMSGEYLALSPTTEVLVRAALVRSFTQLEDVEKVLIQVEGNPLVDATGEPVSFMSASQFIYNDGNEINSYEETKVTLYFANEDGDKLIAASREKFYSTNTPLERFVVEEMIAGPSGKIEGLYPTINPETRILSVMTKDGICYVNLDTSFSTVINNVSSELAVFSIVNSLVELPNINKVQVLVNGAVPSGLENTPYEKRMDCVTTLELEKQKQEEETEGSEEQ